MKKTEFLEQVRQEVEHLKQKATKEEIRRLHFATLEPQSAWSCIYGQMTGHCNSRRAKELHRKKYDELAVEETFTQARKDGVFERGREFTPLEVYITMKGAKKKNVIDYLKGNKKTLKL